MVRRSRFKYFFLIAGMLAFFVAGYATTSALTSSPSEAQSFCSSNQCLSPLSGVTVALGKIAGGTMLPALADAVLSLTAYYDLILTSFETKVVMQIGTVVSNWIDWWDTLWYYNFSPALQSMTRQLSTVDADQSRNMGSFNDMMDRNRVIRKRRDDENRSHRQERPGEGVCAAGTVMGGMVQADTFTRAYSAAAPVDALPRSQRAYGTPAAAGASADMHARFDNYCGRYANPAENNGASGCGGTVAATYSGQDMDVVGQVFEKETINLKDTNIKQTIDDQDTNLIEPFVRDPLPNAATGTATAAATSLGEQRVIEDQVYQTQRQLGHEMYYHVVGERAPGSGMGDFINPMRQAAGIPVTKLSTDPSHNEVMQVMTSEQNRTGNLSVRQIDEPENNTRGVVIQNGIKTMQLDDLLDLLDRYSLVLAGQVSGEVREQSAQDARYSWEPTQ